MKMNAKEKIAKELDALVLLIAEAYNELVTGEISDQEFAAAVDKVTIARDKTADNFLELIKEVVQDTVASVAAETTVTKEVQLDKLTPPPVISDPPTYTRVPDPVKPVMLGESQPLPRTTEDPVDLYAGKHQLPNMPAPSLPNVPNVSSGISEAASVVDIDPGAVDHPAIGLTLEQEKRQEAGLPIKPYRPTIHFNHQGPQEELFNKDAVSLAPPTPTLPIPEPAPKVEAAPKVEPEPLTVPEKSALHQIQDIMIPYREDTDKTLSTLACSVLAVISAALAQEGDTTRYSGMEMLWGALTSAIQKLRKLDKEVKFQGDVLELRETVAAAVEDILTTVATYPLPDEAPTEEPIVPEEKMEKKDGD